MYKRIIILIVFFSLSLNACFLTNNDSDNTPSKVELKKIDNQYHLYVNNKPFYVKGAGLEFGDIENLAQHGANSFRTWRTNNGNQTAIEVLDRAQKNGLMVLMGIEIGKSRHGFNYSDTAMVKSQFESVKKQVLEIKNHPALLAWAIGNELNLNNKDKKTWIAVNDISKMIHRVDGNHPTTTTFAGLTKENIDDFNTYCTDLDFLSIQMYGDIINLQKKLKETKYNGPYMVTEWGATGHWEMPSTKWGIPIEQTSTEKAHSVQERWDKAIDIDKNNCLGSYIFFWGQKQERTPTWYGLFTEQNDEIAVTDVMQKNWTGKYPENRCPEIDTVLLKNKNRFENTYLLPGEKTNFEVIARDPDSDSLKMQIEILSDIPENFREGGDEEKRPAAIFKTIKIPYSEHFSVKAPQKEGAYRIFVYITDGHKNAATANIPFYVLGNDKIKK